jgi:hypothetical protein
MTEREHLPYTFLSKRGHAMVSAVTHLEKATFGEMYLEYSALIQPCNEAGASTFSQQG